MSLDKNRLCEQIVFLEVADALQVSMDPRGYLVAARAVRQTLALELGGLPMQAFVSPLLPSLQITAQNIFFDTHQRLPDLDGSGHAARAKRIGDRLLRRVRAIS